MNSYKQSTSRQAFLNGLFAPANIPNPSFGRLGNEQFGQFQNPMYFDTGAGLLKDTAITERVKLQISSTASIYSIGRISRM